MRIRALVLVFAGLLVLQSAISAQTAKKKTQSRPPRSRPALVPPSPPPPPELSVRNARYVRAVLLPAPQGLEPGEAEVLRASPGNQFVLVKLDPMSSAQSIECSSLALLSADGRAFGCAGLGSSQLIVTSYFCTGYDRTFKRQGDNFVTSCFLGVVRDGKETLETHAAVTRYPEAMFEVPRDTKLESLTLTHSQRGGSVPLVAGPLLAIPNGLSARVTAANSEPAGEYYKKVSLEVEVKNRTEQAYRIHYGSLGLEVGMEGPNPAMAYLSEIEGEDNTKTVLVGAGESRTIHLGFRITNVRDLSLPAAKLWLREETSFPLAPHMDH